MKLIKHDGTVVKEGDELIDFRGEKAKFIQLTRDGSRVYVQRESGWKQEYYPSVFNCEVIDD